MHNNLCRSRFSSTFILQTKGTRMILPYKLERSKEKITARCGLALFEEFIEALEINQLVNNCMPQTLSNHGFEAWTYIQTLLLTLCGGGEAIAETREIKHDEALKTLLQITNVPSESAIGDWLRRMGLRNGTSSVKIINKKFLHTILAKANITEIVLVNDPSIIKSEKRDAKMTYEGYKGYRPAMVLIQELGLIAHYEFRDGNDNGRKFEFFKEIFEVLPSGVKIRRVFMDAEFYDGQIFSLLFEKNIKFAIAVSKDESVMETINQIGADQWKQYEDKHGTMLNKGYAETVHLMNTCHYSFRMIVMRWKDPKNPSAYCYHAIATNMLKIPAQEVIWDYNSRSCSENDIKELKNGFGMHKLPSGDFNANAVYFGIGVLCHNLFIAQKMLTMPEKYHHLTIKTIRWLLLEIPGKIIQKAGQVILKIACSVEKFDLFTSIRSKNYDLLNQ